MPIVHFIPFSTERTCELTPDSFARFYLRTRTVLGPPPFGESRYVPRTSADVAGATSAAGVAPSDVDIITRGSRATARTCGDIDAATIWFRSESEGNKERCERVAGGQALAKGYIDRGGWFPRPTAVTSDSVDQ